VSVDDKTIPPYRMMPGDSALGATAAVRVVAEVALITNDLGADSDASEDLEQERVAEPAVDDVSLLNSGREAAQAGLDLGDHPLIDDPVGDQLTALDGR
jgi:hypothetical protein